MLPMRQDIYSRSTAEQEAMSRSLQLHETTSSAEITVKHDYLKQNC